MVPGGRGPSRLACFQLYIVQARLKGAGPCIALRLRGSSCKLQLLRLSSLGIPSIVHCSGRRLGAWPFILGVLKCAAWGSRYVLQPTRCGHVDGQGRRAVFRQCRSHSGSAKSIAKQHERDGTTDCIVTAHEQVHGLLTLMYMHVLTPCNSSGRPPKQH